MGNKYCVIISAAVIDDRYTQTPEQKVKYAGFPEDLKKYEVMANSMVGGENVIKLYGTNATKKKIDIVLKRLARIEVKEDPDFPESKWTKDADWRIEDPEQVFIIFHSHGSHMYGDVVNGYRFVWPDMRIIRDMSLNITTFRTYTGNPSVLYKGNPIPYDRGIIRYDPEILVDDRWDIRYKTISRKEYERLKASREWKKGGKKWLLVKVETSPSSRDIDYPCVYEWVWDGCIHIPTQAQLQSMRPVDKWSVWKNCPNVNLYFVDENGSEALLASNACGFHIEDGNRLIYSLNATPPKNEPDMFYSYLPPPGTYRLSDTMSGIAIHETTESPSRFYTDRDLLEIAKKSQTNMFFIIDTCFAGRFYNMTEKLKLLNPSVEFGAFVACQWDKLNWAGGRPEGAFGPPGHFCAGIYTEMYAKGFLGLPDWRKKCTYREVYDNIKKCCTSNEWVWNYSTREKDYLTQYPTYSRRQKGIFGDDEAVPGKVLPTIIPYL